MTIFSKPTGLPLTEVFIETGTHLGDSLAAALACGYQLCRSVEFVESLYQRAKERFAGEPRVQLFCGSSPETLGQMIDPSRTTTFWLDAHYSGTDPDWQDARYGECPLLAELKVIMAAAWQRPPIICIDDAIIFKDQGWDAANPGFELSLYTRSHWPRLPDIKQLLPGFVVREENLMLICCQEGDEHGS